MTEFIKASQVFFDNPATTVDEVLAFLSQQAVAQGVSDDEAAVLAAFRAREDQGTTGMTGGFAIPHCKSDAVKEASVFVVKFADAVAWDSMDGNPITVAIALLVPEGEAGTTFLRLLSQVAVMLMDEEFRAAVVDSIDAEAIAAIVNKRFEDGLIK